MNLTKNFAAWVVLVANLLMMAALSLHVVRTPAGLTVVAKDHLTLVDTYADARTWGASEFAQHAALVARLTQAGKGDMLAPADAPATSAAGKPAPEAALDGGTTSVLTVTRSEKAPATPPARPRAVESKPTPASGGSKIFPID